MKPCWRCSQPGDHEWPSECIASLQRALDECKREHKRAKRAEAERDEALEHLNSLLDPDDEMTSEGLTITERDLREAAKLQTKRLKTAEAERDKYRAALHWFTSSGGRCPGCGCTERQDHKKGCWCYEVANEQR